MKKILLYLAIIFILVSMFLIFGTFFRINYNIRQNNRVIDYINTLNLNGDSIDDYDYYPKLEIYKKDYIGLLTIEDLSISIPIEDKCTNIIQSLCMYKDSPLSLIASNLNDSITNYKDIDVDYNIFFKNFWGESKNYLVDKIIHTDNLNNIDKYFANLILIVKDYYKLEYTIYLCN